VSWSRVVGDPAEARAALADPGDVLDLRARAELDEDWRALGAVEVVPGELAVPVPQRLPDVTATQALGARLAADLRAGDLVVLSGPLGAGKTALTQGIGAALQVRGAVTSPTFVLARVHRGPLPLVHVDAYRLRDSPGGADLDDLDLDDELPYSVTVVEWGEGVVEQVSESRLHVVLERSGAGDEGEERIARILCSGLRWSAGGTG
jgi:tRNA threonylcarbamoyladenosine biosynthesis protein TsaE